MIAWRLTTVVAYSRLSKAVGNNPHGLRRNTQGITTCLRRSVTLLDCHVPHHAGSCATTLRGLLKIAVADAGYRAYGWPFDQSYHKHDVQCELPTAESDWYQSASMDGIPDSMKSAPESR